MLVTSEVFQDYGLHPCPKYLQAQRTGAIDRMELFVFSHLGLQIIGFYGIVKKGGKQISIGAKDIK